MKKQTIWKCLALSACVVAGSVLPAAALEEADFEYDTTKQLYNLCSVAQDHEYSSPALAACRGFIAGAIQYHDGVSDGKNLKRLVCYPADATLEKGRLAFVAWAETKGNDAALMSELPVRGLIRGLAAAYPCAK